MSKHIIIGPAWETAAGADLTERKKQHRVREAEEKETRGGMNKENDVQFLFF